ncbi:MAG: hypothetical protein WCR79_00525 [Fusobacterium sp.]
MKKKGFFLIEALISLNIFLVFSYCFFKVILISFNVNKKVISLSVNSREYYRMLEIFRENIESSQIIKIENKKELTLEKDKVISVYKFTEDLKLLKKEGTKEEDIYIENIWGEFYIEKNLLVVKTKYKDERADYVFFKK